MEKESTFIKIVFAVAISAAIITVAFWLNALYVDYLHEKNNNDTIEIVDVPVIETNVYEFKQPEL